MASREQIDLMADWYDHTGFEFMGKEKAKANDYVGFVALWNQNVEWLRDLANETAHMVNEYERAHS